MKKVVALLGYILLLQAAVAGIQSPESAMAALFPAIADWQKKDNPAFYYSATLYEYIDGAAENFLSYDFQELAVQTYENTGKKSLTVEIYRHSDAQNAFGIFSSEKPLVGNYLGIGTQGYYEKGTLNFLYGVYYVKMNAFELGVSDRQILTQIATALVRRLGPQPGMPAVLTWFPNDGKVAHSERFLLKNVLGHRFLHSAFMADYTQGSARFSAFIMLAADAPEAKTILTQWLAVAGQKEITPSADCSLHIRDPYNGTIAVEWHSRFLWGTVNAPENDSTSFREAVKHKLPLATEVR